MKRAFFISKICYIRNLIIKKFNVNEAGTNNFLICHLDIHKVHKIFLVIIRIKFYLITH